MAAAVGTTMTWPWTSEQLKMGARLTPFAASNSGGITHEHTIIHP